MTGRPCKFCQAQLRWIQSPLGGRIPCEEPAHVLHPDGLTHHTHELVGDELRIHPVPGPLPKGTYFTANGQRYQEFEAPRGHELWRSHWDRCPGANFVRKKRRKNAKKDADD